MTFYLFLQNITGALGKKWKGKVKRLNSPDINGTWSTCLSKAGNLFCTLVISTTVFMIQKEIFRFFKSRNYKREYLIYLMQYELYNKQYIGKAEADFNIRPNDHRKDVKDTDAILTCKYF